MLLALTIVGRERQYFSRLCELIRLVNLEDMLTVIRK